MDISTHTGLVGVIIGVLIWLIGVGVNSPIIVKLGKAVVIIGAIIFVLALLGVAL